jgi:amidophosphoribosyltransferase
MGENLAKLWREQHPDIIPDVIIPAPFTSNTAALAMARELNVVYSEGLYKNPFIGRTFIMPEGQKRQKQIRYKLVPQPFEIQNKKVMIVDDSIVRGNTSREIVKMIREHDAKEVYFASACPPVISPCFYGIDTPDKEQLIANKYSIEEIRQFLDVDVLIYQELEDLVEAVTRKGEHHIEKPCLACLNGCYVTSHIDDKKMTQLSQERHEISEVI